MMYAVLHRLFGWDFVQCQDNHYQGVVKVRIDAEGKPFYWRYKHIKALTRITNPHASGVVNLPAL
jgi:hypothetical protein